MKNDNTSITADMLAKGGQYVRLKPDIVRALKEQQAEEQREMLDRVKRESLEIVRILKGPNSNAHRRLALECALVELSNQSKVGVTDPYVVKIFYLQAMCAAFFHPSQFGDRQVIDDVYAALNPKTKVEALKGIVQRYRCDYDAEAPEREVIDLNCWRQSRPRPLKGGER